MKKSFIIFGAGNSSLSEDIEVSIVPRVVNASLTCSSRNLYVIPFGNAIFVSDIFCCFRNKLFSLDFAPITMLELGYQS